MSDYEKLEARLGYVFKDASLLRIALTHPSYATEHGVRSNQRLEFLGDAVLELCVSRVLYEHERDIDEGVLTKWRAQLVCESSLANCARALHLGEELRMSSGAYTDHLADKPSVLCDVMESVLAAVYLDGGIESAARLVDKILGARMQSAPDIPDDYKSRLQIIAQARLIPLSYSELSVTGPDHARRFVYQCEYGELTTSGSGGSKKLAQQEAARRMLELLNNTEKGGSDE